MNRYQIRSRWVILCLLAPAMVFFLPSASHAGEKQEEPTPPAFPVKVSAELDLIKVSKIDDRSENFEVEFFLNQTWTDPRLAFDATLEKKAKRVVPIDQIWTPKIQLTDKIDATIESGDAAHVFPDGRVLLHQAFKASIPTRFDLHTFPLDSHKLTIVFESPLYEQSDVEILAKEIRLTDTQVENQVPNGWHLKGLSTSSGSKIYPSIQETYARAEFKIEVLRDSHYYSWAVVLPLILIVATAWTTFWMETNEFSTQVGVVITSLLTIVAFKISIDSALPPLSYMTRIDLLFVLCQLSVFSTLLLCIALKMLDSATHPNSDAIAHSLRLNCRWLPILVLSICCLPIPFVSPSIITMAILIGVGGLFAFLRPSPRRMRRWVRAILHPEAFLDTAGRTFTESNPEPPTTTTAANAPKTVAWQHPPDSTTQPMLQTRIDRPVFTPRFRNGSLKP